MVEQLPEEVELLRRELDLLVTDVHLAAAGVDDGGRRGVSSALSRSLRSGEERRSTDFTRATSSRGIERLREVVVGADLEADDLVDVLVARGQHQDRDVGGLADPPADLDAVDVREVEVEDDQRRLLGGAIVSASPPVAAVRTV